MSNQINDPNLSFEQDAIAPADSSNNVQTKHSAINRHVLDELTLGDFDLLYELINIYLEQFKQQLQELETAIKTKNSELLFTVAHKAVGGNATFGMTSIVPPLRQLEKMGREAEFSGALELLAFIRLESIAISRELQAILNKKSS